MKERNSLLMLLLVDRQFNLNGAKADLWIERFAAAAVDGRYFCRPLLPVFIASQLMLTAHSCRPDLGISHLSLALLELAARSLQQQHSLRITNAQNVISQAEMR